MTATYIQAGLSVPPPPPSPSPDRTYLWWYDGDKTRPTIDKLHDALDRYRRKFRREPREVLCNIVDANELRALDLDLVIRDVSFIGTRGHFYVGGGP